VARIADGAERLLLQERNIASLARAHRTRPPSMKRARRAYDPMYDSAILLGIGSAHAISDNGDDQPRPVGVLWLPDPEQRRGWRERYVMSEVKPNGERRRIGFRKPGE
jgi:hypothetical protein